MMDAIVASKDGREAELTALARLVIYAQAAAKDLRTEEIEHQLAKSLEAIVRELEGSSGNSGGLVDIYPAPSIATYQ